MSYCSIKEAAEIIGVSRPTIYAMIEAGKLKRQVMLGRPALRKADVERVAGGRPKGKSATKGTEK